MQDATQAQPPTKLPAYVREWVGARVECMTTRGREHGTVSDAIKRRSVDRMVIRLTVLLDSGGMKYALDSEVTRIAPPSIRNLEVTAYGTKLAGDATQNGSVAETGTHPGNADSARNCA